MKFTLSLTTDEDTGFTGWLPAGVPAFFTPAVGFGLAHDLLEHTHLGTIVDEAMAFGCMLWGRGQGGWWRNQFLHRTWGSQVDGDIARFIAMSRGVKARPGTRRLSAALEEQIAEATKGVLRLIPDEADCYRYDLDRADEDIQNYMDWVRAGFRSAALRIGKYMTPSEFCEMFRELMVHPLVDRPLSRVESELDKLIVRINWKTQSVRIELDSYQDLYA